MMFAGKPTCWTWKYPSETSTQTNNFWVPFVCFQGCTLFFLFETTKERMWFGVFVDEFVVDVFFGHERLWVIGEFGCFLSYMVIWVFFVQPSNVPFHLFQGENMCWNMLKLHVKLMLFFPTQKKCSNQSSTVEFFLSHQKRRLYFSRTSRKPWCSPQRLPTIRVYIWCPVVAVAPLLPL